MTKLTILLLVYLFLALGTPGDAPDAKQVNFLPEPIVNLINH